MVAKEHEQKIEEPDRLKSEAELIGRIIQSEQKLSDYFTTIISKSVTEQIERRNLARLRLFGIVSVILVGVIIPAVTLWIRGTITSQTEVAIQTQFSEAIQALEDRFGKETQRLEKEFESFLTNERTYLTFANYTLYLAERSQVPERELNNVLTMLEHVTSQPNLNSRPDFPFLVDLVARTAINHDYLEALIELEENFQDELTFSPRTMPRLARYYGESLVGDRFTSRHKLEAAAGKFQRYLDLSSKSPDFERLLSLQLMVERKLDNETAAERAQDIRLYVLDLAPEKQASFISETVRYSNPDFRDVPPTARNRRIAITAGTMVVDQKQFYADMLRDKAVQAALTQLAKRQANMENMGIATALTAFRRVFLRAMSSGEDPRLKQIVRKIVNADFNPWLNNPLIIESLKFYNAKTSAYSQEKIMELERKWRDEFASDDYELIDEVLDRPVSRYLRRVKLNALGTVHEILLMDGVGLLTGASDPNDDYWQGEEPKWLETYRVGKDALHISDLKFDDSALAWEIQISLPVVDPETDKPIGAVTIGLDPSALVDTVI